MGSVADWKAMLTAVERWAAKPVIDSILPFAQARDGYLRLASGRQFGKVVVQISADQAGALGA